MDKGASPPVSTYLALGSSIAGLGNTVVLPHDYITTIISRTAQTNYLKNLL